jgi:hypothetical protein
VLLVACYHQLTCFCCRPEGHCSGNRPHITIRSRFEETFIPSFNHPYIMAMLCCLCLCHPFRPLQQHSATSRHSQLP